MSLLIALKFLKNKKRNFDSVLALCEKAPLFQEIDGQYLVGFPREREGVRLAMAVLEEMRLASWKFILFAGGSVVAKANAARNVLDCASTCYRSKNKEAYCTETYDSPLEHFSKRGAFEFKLDELGDPLPEDLTWTLPCKLLNGFLQFSKDELAQPLEKIEAVAEERLISICPHFYARRFEIREKAKQITRPNRYW